MRDGNMASNAPTGTSVWNDTYTPEDRPSRLVRSNFAALQCLHRPQISFICRDLRKAFSAHLILAGWPKFLPSPRAVFLIIYSRKFPEFDSTPQIYIGALLVEKKLTFRP
jgi:hypothetical protein